jgi:hypothetical protein
MEGDRIIKDIAKDRQIFFKRRHRLERKFPKEVLDKLETRNFFNKNY